MSLSFCVLGSGSAGNSTLLVLPHEAGDRFALIDCGLSPRRTAAALAPHGVDLDHVTDILLTHLDGDHCHAGWNAVIERSDLSVHVHRRHRSPAARSGLPTSRLHLFDEAPFALGDAIRVDSSLLAHDDLGTVGYVIEHAGARLGWATDLGRVPSALYDFFVDLDALGIESNYDRQLQLASDRPDFLKQRIMGGAGHLSNEQSLEAVLRVASRSNLVHIALLHLSRQCNDPRVVTRLYGEQAAHLLDRLTITSQYTPSPMLHVAPGPRTARSGQQMTMFDSTQP
ncbi:MAG: MBL fold metallo-hydrolase [Planctomycetota bacterium]|jgi:phosphoribosyl 1,2-cyclic phosphodiesterase